MSRLLTVAGAIVDRIKINALTRETRNGSAVWIKRRRPIAGPIMTLANGFFHVVGNPVQTLTDASVWQNWEIDCFQNLHGDTFHAFPCGSDAVGADELPGTSLARHLDDGTLTEEMLIATGRELRRAHEWRCDHFKAAWSHGDPHSGNFIFDAAENRARLIDFEVMHHPSLSADARHADDLLVFLQDMMGRIKADRWIPCACAFLEGYGRRDIIDLFAKIFVLPSGLARIWWSVRTTYLSRPKLRRRIDQLHAALPSIAASVPEDIPRHDPLAYR